MKIERLPTDAALALAKTLPCAFITELSRVIYGSTPTAFAFEEWTEAHFFDAHRELRFLSEEDELKATLLTDEIDDFIIDVPVTLMLPNGTQNAWIHKYVSTDEDGQAYIAAIRFTEKENDE